MNREKRNNIFEEKKCFVDRTMNKHYIILRSCYMDLDDVRQELYLTLLQLLDRYEPEKCPNLDAYLMLHLKYKVWNLAKGSHCTGMPEAPVRGFSLISLDVLAEDFDYYVPENYNNQGTFSSLWIEDAIDALPAKERRIINALLLGKRRIHCNKVLKSARRMLLKSHYKFSEMMV